MDVGGKCSHRPRVVVLVRGADLPGCAMADIERNGVECVRAASAYEAAAEMLAAPTAALVIDLRAMSPRHARLIEIAREMDVEMLAVGALPIGMSAEDLSGVRLVAGRQLPATLRESVESRESAAAPEPPEPPVKPEAKARPAPEAPALKLTPAKRPAGPQSPQPRQPAPATSEIPSDANPAFEATEPVDKAQAADLPAAPEQRTYQPATTPDASRLLTPEELAALLEDEQ